MSSEHYTVTAADDFAAEMRRLITNLETANNQLRRLMQPGQSRNEIHTSLETAFSALRRADHSISNLWRFVAPATPEKAISPPLPPQAPATSKCADAPVQTSLDPDIYLDPYQYPA